MTTQEELWRKLMGLHADPQGVPSEFEEGKECALLYDRIDAARHRLCQRLGMEFEDGDLVEILNCEEAICKQVACKMYEYGRKTQSPA